jgi:phage anti-repressor protein
LYHYLIKSVVMELQILVSKKGTKVVTATNLHVALGLPNKHYAANVRRWLNDVYEFRDGIRKPEHHKDFARRPAKGDVVDDYYLTVELAKLITLNSKSKVKQKYATWLLNLEDQVENAELLTTDQVLAVLELAKVMGLVSCQAACEQQHLETYEERNSGSAANWWSFRSNVLGYSTDKLKESLHRLGKKSNGKSQREMLMQVDKYEMVRTAVIDLFMALGKPERYAKNLGNLAKTFARELGVEIFDDRNAPPAFTPNLNPELVNEVKNLRKGRYLQLWESQKMAS